MRRLAPVVLVLAGCNRDAEHEVIAAGPPPPAASAALVRVPGLPHSANIREVAATEQGDAAISVDEQGGLRLWPTLDGSREPVAISAPAAMQVAIASAGSDLIVAVLDQAGSAHVLRAGRDGVVHGRAQVAGDVAITQIAAIDGHVLALRADQTIEELDGSAVVRGRIAAAPGERIAAVVVRSGGVVAMLAGDGGTSTTLRWIDRTGGLQWGLRVTLPAAVWPDSVALSPSHRRLAASEAKSRQMFIYDLAVAPAVVTSTDVQVAPGEPLGFTDDDHVVALAPLRWWTIGTKTTDPWAPTTPPNPVPASAMAGGAAANGKVVSALGVTLALVTEQRTRYLGWAELGVQSASLVADRVAISTSTRHFAWLDTSLAEQHVADLPEDTAYGEALDDRHLITERSLPHGGLEVQLVDVDHLDHPATLGDVDSVQRFDFEPHTQMLAITEGATIHRYQLDLARDVVTRLSDVKLHTEATYFRLLDPSLATGAFAVVGSSETAGTRLDELRDVGGKIERRKGRVVPGTVVVVDERGGVIGNDGNELQIDRGGDVVKIPVVDAVVPDHGAGNVVAYTGTRVTLYGRDGRERWRQAEWSVYSAAFTPDDRELLVRGMGGLVMIDVATGERLATACGWRFGIYDRPPDGGAPGSGSVCEDSGQ